MAQAANGQGSLGARRAGRSRPSNRLQAGAQRRMRQALGIGDDDAMKWHRRYTTRPVSNWRAHRAMRLVVGSA